MIDLHTHTIFSDGDLIPAELARRAEVRGLKTIALTDHVDSSNLDFIIPRLQAAAAEISSWGKIRIIPGAELTHIAPDAIAKLVQRARELGAKIVVVHGETLAEPVAPGTNRAAIMAEVDILAHPGLISLQDAKLACEKGVCLEITSRSGHSLSNGHVARAAEKTGARLVFNTDSHSPDDLRSMPEAKKIALGAGLSEAAFKKMLQNARALVEKIK